MTYRTVVIVGAGAWGTALAISLSAALDVILVVRSPAQAEELGRTRMNRRYLPDCPIPDKVQVTADLAAAMAKADMVIIATPVSGFESVLKLVAAIRKELPVIWGCKGICPQTGEPLSTIAEKVMGPDACFGAISGPCFAAGLASKHPTAVVVATNCGRQTTLAIAKSLSNNYLRVYSNSDLTGVQICGAIKNVYAIAAGVIDGCGWGENTRAGMLTRAVAEARTYIKKHDSKLSTLMGLAGFGDLYLSCGSRLSRNYQVGMALAAGTPLATALENLGHVAEGVNTTRLIHKRASELGLDMPIVTAVWQILGGERTPRECVEALMSRSIKHEKPSSSPSPGHA